MNNLEPLRFRNDTSQSKAKAKAKPAAVKQQP
jgi:hypothetical protein